MNRVLLIEDTAETFHLVKRALGSAIQLNWAKTYSEGALAINKADYDLVLIDLLLPGGSGYQLCDLARNIGQSHGVAIILMTSQNDLSTKIEGFNLGIDDFIAKPFDSFELKARVDARLRKRERKKNEFDQFMIGDLEIDRYTQRAIMLVNDVPQDLGLTPIEFRVLLSLSREMGRVYTRDEVMRAVWGEHIHVNSRSVDTHVSKLRKKLQDRGNYIEAMHGSGYRLRIESTARDHTFRIPPPKLHDVIDFQTCW